MVSINNGFIVVAFVAIVMFVPKVRSCVRAIEIFLKKISIPKLFIETNENLTV